MAKAKPSKPQTAAIAETPAVDTTAPVGYQEPAVPGTVLENPPVMSDKELIAKTKADVAAKAKADKEAAAKEKADLKATKDAAKAAEKEVKEKARAEAKKAREDRLATLAAEGKQYVGSMLALADRVNSGAYVKGATGQLRSNDELAQALDGVSPTDVIRIGLDMLSLENNPYHNLNVGQQSMNLRNRMRGAIKKEVINIAGIKDYIVRNKINVTTPASLEAKAKEKAEKKVKADADKATKAAALASAKVVDKAVAAEDAPNAVNSGE